MRFNRRSVLLGAASALISEKSSGKGFILLGSANKPFGPGSPGFLSAATSTFSITNLFKPSNDFTNAAWVKAGITAAAPTLTANNATAPDGSTTASTLSFPAVGSGQASIMYTATGSAANLPYTADLYIKGVAGGERLWLSASATGVAGSYTRVPVVATTAWQRIPLSWLNKVAGQLFEIGIDTRDTGQTAQAAQAIQICWSQLVLSAYEWPYIPTTTVAVTQNQITPLPAGIAFRDFSSLRPYAGNPVLPQNTSSYNVNGTTNDYFDGANKIGSTYYATASGDVSGGTWNNIYLTTGNSILTMVDTGSVLVTHTPAAWDDHYLLHGTLWNKTGSTWYLYYSAMNASNQSGIGVAISTTGPTGPFTKYAGNPLIGPTSVTNIGSPSLPCVIQIGSNLVMYTAFANNNGTLIVYFTSPASDGLTWTFGGIALNAVIAGVDWESGVGTLSGLIDPRVKPSLLHPGFYEMVYTAFFSSPATQQLGYAISADGFKWFKYNPAAILAANTPQFPTNIAYVGDAVLYEDGANFYLTFDISNGTNAASGNAVIMADA